MNKQTVLNYLIKDNCEFLNLNLLIIKNEFTKYPTLVVGELTAIVKQCKEIINDFRDIFNEIKTHLINKDPLGNITVSISNNKHFYIRHFIEYDHKKNKFIDCPPHEEYNKLKSEIKFTFDRFVSSLSYYSRKEYNITDIKNIIDLLDDLESFNIYIYKFINKYEEKIENTELDFMESEPLYKID